jgi:hypothetical protein
VEFGAVRDPDDTKTDFHRFAPATPLSGRWCPHGVFSLLWAAHRNHNGTEGIQELFRIFVFDGFEAFVEGGVIFLGHVDFVEVNLGHATVEVIENMVHYTEGVNFHDIGLTDTHGTTDGLVNDRGIPVLTEEIYPFGEL